LWQFGLVALHLFIDLYEIKQMDQPMSTDQFKAVFTS
jgi:hypothetical protein